MLTERVKMMVLSVDTPAQLPVGCGDGDRRRPARIPGYEDPGGTDLDLVA